MLGLAGHFSLEGGEVGGDTVDVKVNNGLTKSAKIEMQKELTAENQSVSSF